MSPERSRYELVSRRAMLKASAALGAGLVLPSCGNSDVDVFAGALTDPVAPAPAAESPAVQQAVIAEPTAQFSVVEPTVAAEPPADASVAEEAVIEQPTAEPLATEAPPAEQPTAEPLPADVAAQLAVAGEMVISFTYTQGATGKNERPYVAVWIENEAGELVHTVSLWYQQRRRGERWLDHLDRWWAVDQGRIAAGGINNAATISSATRQAGSYAVAWDGLIDGVSAAAAPYFVCIESAREEGPYSLIRQRFDLAGVLAETALPGNGELSAAAVRIDV